MHKILATLMYQCSVWEDKSSMESDDRSQLVIKHTYTYYVDI